MAVCVYGVKGGGVRDICNKDDREDFRTRTGENPWPDVVAVELVW